MVVKTLVVGPLQTNCYVLGCERTKQGIVIDPGDDASKILEALEQHGLTLVQIVNTHAHFDHVLGVEELKLATTAPFFLHRLEEPVLDGMPAHVQTWLGFDPGPPPQPDGHLEHGDLVQFGQQQLEVRWTPGHSPGSITLVDHTGRRAFVGDTLFAGGIGRTDLPGGDFNQLLESIRRQIFTLPDDYEVMPGHGPTTTVGREKRTNPFF
ncbi:MAG TPA: MBL fold metallo-hydrolase [Anaerolineae bacterium]|nr:MBL fold metallo-hydrolase [Anaerolineae bacterium]HIQ04154.1 MBL fold metallo-hydrolase [Anaerolineae bacterium]